MSHAQDFVLVQGFQSGFGHGRDGDSVAKCVKYFDRIAGIAIWRRMMNDNLHDIATAQAVFWIVATEGCVSVEIEAHSALFLRD